MYAQNIKENGMNKNSLKEFNTDVYRKVYNPKYF